MTSTLNLHIADCDVVIEGPQSLLAVVDRMLLHVDRASAQMLDPATISVSFESNVWRLVGQAPASRKVLGSRCALPQVAGAVVSSVLSEIAFRRNVEVWRAAVVERDGRALVFIGDDWESAVTLTAHLHSRGWKILGGDYALISGDTLVVSAFKKVLHANSSCIASFPPWYRRAIEASPWYSTSQVIAFYAIDPQLADDGDAWGSHAALGAVLKVDGQFADHPSIEPLDHIAFTASLRRRDLERAGIEVAALVVGEFIETCDLLDRWFSTLAVSV